MFLCPHPTVSAPPSPLSWSVVYQLGHAKRKSTSHLPAPRPPSPQNTSTLHSLVHSSTIVTTNHQQRQKIQAEAVQLLQELSLASDEALARVRDLPNLVPALSAIAYPGIGPLGLLRGRIGRSLGNVGGLAGGGVVGDGGGNGGGGDGAGVGRVGAAQRRKEAAVAEAAVSGASKVGGVHHERTWMPLSRRCVLFGHFFHLFFVCVFSALCFASHIFEPISRLFFTFSGIFLLLFGSYFLFFIGLRVSFGVTFLWLVRLREKKRSKTPRFSSFLFFI